MKKNSLIKCLGVALTAALFLSGCDSGGGSDPVFNGGGGVAATGGGGGAAAAAATTGGTTGFGLTGGTITGNFGGTGGTTGGVATTTTTTTAGTTTTTTAGTTTTGGANNFLASPLTNTDFRTGLTNPTFSVMHTVGGTARVAFVQGFGNQVQTDPLAFINQSGTFNAATGGFPLQVVQRSATSPIPDSQLILSPFDIASDGTNLYFTAGFDLDNQGAIIRVSNITEAGGVISGDFEDLTASSVRPRNPAFLTIATAGNTVFVYWTEYTAANVSGSVRRWRSDTNAVDIIVNNLNFPAGLDHDGTNLVICDSAGGGGGNGRVIRVPLIPTTIPVNGDASPDVTLIAPATGEQPIIRPFDVDFDGTNGFFFTEGGAIETPANNLTFPQPLGQGNGAVRFLPRASAIAELVSNGLANPTGLDTLNINGDATVSVAFAETLPTNGRILRREVNTANITLTAPTEADTGLFNPLGVAILSETLPAIEALVNYRGGQANGFVRVYGP